MIDDELRSFIESDFGVRGLSHPPWTRPLSLPRADPRRTSPCAAQYNPIPRPRKKAASSTFAVNLPLFGKGVQDDDEFLSSAKVEVGRLDTQYADASKAADKLSKTRKGASHGPVRPSMSKR